MCGRFALGIPRKKLAKHFGLAEIPNAPARYNIAPGSLIEAVLEQPGSGRETRLFYWGFLPGFIKDKSQAQRMINARAESAGQKPYFRSALARRRCLIPAQGFFEWKPEGKGKTPYYFSHPEAEPLGLAGIYEYWQGPGDEFEESCAILTREALAPVSLAHARMPLIINPEDYAAWLDPKSQHPKELGGLLAASPNFSLAAWPVGPEINSPASQGEGLIAAACSRPALFNGD